MILMFRLEWTRSNKQHNRRTERSCRLDVVVAWWTGDLNYSACNCNSNSTRTHLFLVSLSQCACLPAILFKSHTRRRRRPRQQEYKVVTCGFLCSGSLDGAAAASGGGGAAAAVVIGISVPQHTTRQNNQFVKTRPLSIDPQKLKLNATTETEARLQA